MSTNDPKPNQPTAGCSIVCPRCLKCLDNQPEHGNCAGCGTAYTKRHLRKLRINRLCRHCGYDLRGHQQQGKCPECGNEFKYFTQPASPYQLEAPPSREYKQPMPILCAAPPLLLIAAIFLYGITADIVPILCALIAGPTALIALIVTIQYNTRKALHQNTGTDMLFNVLAVLNASTVLAVTAACCGPMLLAGVCML